MKSWKMKIGSTFQEDWAPEHAWGGARELGYSWFPARLGLEPQGGSHEATVLQLRFPGQGPQEAEGVAGWG